VKYKSNKVALTTYCNRHLLPAAHDAVVDSAHTGKFR